MWAFPGGFVYENKDIDLAIKRELFEETLIEHSGLQQLHAFGTPFRDLRDRVISIAYYGFVVEKKVAVAAAAAKTAQ